MGPRATGRVRNAGRLSRILIPEPALYLQFIAPFADNSSGGSGGGGSGSHVEGANQSSNNNNNSRQQQQLQQQHNNSSEFPANILTAQSPGLTVLKNSPPNIVHLIAHPSQSVIQSSVIQSANNNHIQPMMHSSKGGMGGPPQGTTVYVQKANSVIQAPGIRVSLSLIFQSRRLLFLFKT